ncbi:MAG: hypothetical protein E5W93_02005 [Mesorhizobium sp.]|nr:MAG: hypothetical protein E5W93_02005 [Mesorhizobium sp.]
MNSIHAGSFARTVTALRSLRQTNRRGPGTRLRQARLATDQRRIIPDHGGHEADHGAHQRLITDLAAIDKRNRVAAENIRGEPHRDGRRQLGPLLGGIVAPLVLRHEVADHEAKERLIAQSDLDWTIVRPPKLGNGPATGRFRHGDGIRAGSLLPTLARADVAAFMLAQVSDTTYSRKAVTLLP